MAQPRSLGWVFAEINNFQLLLLRWLPRRPGLEAPWSKLAEELGDRVAPELVRAHLGDLRLWGLADYDPAVEGGWVATYPAVAEYLPARRGVSLAQRPELVNSDHLHLCVRGFPVPA